MSLGEEDQSTALLGCASPNCQLLTHSTCKFGGYCCGQCYATRGEDHCEQCEAKPAASENIVREDPTWRPGAKAGAQSCEERLAFAQEAYGNGGKWLEQGEVDKAWDYYMEGLLILNASPHVDEELDANQQEHQHSLTVDLLLSLALISLRQRKWNLAVDWSNAVLDFHDRTRAVSEDDVREAILCSARAYIHLKAGAVLDDALSDLKDAQKTYPNSSDVKAEIDLIEVLRSCRASATCQEMTHKPQISERKLQKWAAQSARRWAQENAQREAKGKPALSLDEWYKMQEEAEEAEDEEIESEGEEQQVDDRGAPKENASDLMALEQSMQVKVKDWQNKIQNLVPYVDIDGCISQEDWDDFVELRRCQQMANCSPHDVQLYGDKPILVTAPHCTHLLRDNHEPHLLEEQTFEIANAIARELNGTSLTWSVVERQRVSLLWQMGKRRDEASPGALLNPSNRDPNYMHLLEPLSKSEELKGAREWNQEFNRMIHTFGPQTLLLHIDVHGCRNPPVTESHLTVGLGAMWERTVKNSVDELDALQEFGKSLEANLTSVLKGIKLKPRAKLVRISYNDAYCGAWPVGTQRNTQTQQSVQDGFQHAVQLEMSKALRSSLQKNPASIPRLCAALRTAWSRSKRKAGAGIQVACQ